VTETLRGDRALERDANAQHPHDHFTTSSLLRPSVTGMQTNEATTVADVREVA
jgi:hypothetical protein